MKIGEAVKLLEEELISFDEGECLDWQNAVKLGIEALKRIIAWRNDNDEDLLWGLSGETED